MGRMEEKEGRMEARKLGGLQVRKVQKSVKLRRTRLQL